ncbi:MAG: MBL fold metallo-hydrolase [Planctomycetota bacterium]|jgi:L-ascorbate metabolism protein UlaG (beta-lactamase superfamily)
MNALIREISQTRVEPGGLQIWWIGQEGFILKSSAQIVYIDPYLSTYAEKTTRGKPNEHVRIKPAPMNPEDVTHADIVFCTHDHADHIDPEGIPMIADRSARVCFVVPECARETMRGFAIADDRIHTMKGDDELRLNDIRICAVPAKHEEFDEHPQKGYPYLSYVINIDGLTVFHAGDTIPYDGQVERLKRHRIDLAFLPINGRDESRHGLGLEGNFTSEEAIRFAIEINAGLTIPMHYDMFTINTADINEFRRIADKCNLRYLIMDYAGHIHFPVEITHASHRPK